MDDIPDGARVSEHDLADRGRRHALRREKHDLRSAPRHHRPRCATHDPKQPLALLASDLPNCTLAAIATPGRVAKLEAGLTDPRFDVLVALSDGLGVGLSALIPDDEEGQAS
jgi:hypothetical protein